MRQEENRDTIEAVKKQGVDAKDNVLEVVVDCVALGLPIPGIC